MLDNNKILVQAANNEQENLSLKTGKTLEFHIWKRVGTLCYCIYVFCIFEKT